MAGCLLCIMAVDVLIISSCFGPGNTKVWDDCVIVEIGLERVASNKLALIDRKFLMARDANAALEL
jgi:hypothetical protein